MQKNKTILYIIAYLLLVLTVWGGFSSMPSPKVVAPEIHAGVLDLSSRDFDETVYSCRDNWSSWPEQLYTPQDFASGAVTEPPQLLHGDDFKQIQYATHRLRLTLPHGKTYGITMRSSDYSMRLFLNGEEIDSVGKPGTTRETTIPRVAQRTYYFTPADGTVEIIVQAANFVYSSDGAWPPPFTIGFSQNITKMTEKNTAFSYVVVGCLVTSFLYHLGLFILNRSRKNVLLFSLCCLLLAAMTQSPILAFFPNYNWFIGIRVEYIVNTLAFAMLVLFLDTLSPNLFHKVVTRAYYSIAGLFVLICVFFDPLVSSNMIKYFENASMAIIGYVFVRMAMAMKGGHSRNRLAFIGILVTGLFGLNDILFSRGIVLLGQASRQFITTTVGMVFFVFCFSLVLSIEYAETERAMLDARAKEQALAIENAALDRVNRMKGDLLATVSHETRTPLAVLSGYAELISMEMKRKGVDLQTAIDLDQIADETQRIAAIMEEMQTMSRVKDGVAHKAWIQLADIISQTARLYTPILKRKNITLVVDVPEDLPPVLASADELTQVMFNLLTNARNHTENGEVNIHAQSSGREIAVTVSDTGTGIQPSFLPHAFERYKSDDPEGTGLGLAICKEIIKAHDGTITIESEIDKGTAVRFTLPVDKEDGNGRAENGLIG